MWEATKRKKIVKRKLCHKKNPKCDKITKTSKKDSLL